MESELTSRINEFESLLKPSFISEDYRLTSWEIFKNYGLTVRRVYFIEMKKGETRGFHAHRNLTQLFVVQSGQVCLELRQQSQSNSKSILLNRCEGIILERMTWRVFECISENASIFVAADGEYDESDYIRDFDSFLEYPNDK